MVDVLGIYASLKINKFILYFYIACLLTLIALKLPYLEKINSASYISYNECNFKYDCDSPPISIQHQLGDLLVCSCLLVVFEAIHIYVTITYMIRIHQLDKQAIERVKSTINNFKAYL